MAWTTTNPVSIGKATQKAHYDKLWDNVGFGRTSADGNWTTITMNDGGVITTASGPVITFDDTNNYLEITGCKVGIGTAAPDQTLHVMKGSAGVIDSNSDAAITIENSGHAVLQLLCPAADTGYILFGDPVSASVGQVFYNHATDIMGFVTDGSARAYIDPLGNVGIGTSTFGASAQKVLTFGIGVAGAYTADLAQMWAADITAGDIRLYVQTELGSPIAIGSDSIVFAADGDDPPAAGQVCRQNVVKGWLTMDMSVAAGSAIKDSYNISSVSDNGTGHWVVNWDLDFANVNYCVAGSANANCYISDEGTATTYVGIVARNDAGTDVDVTRARIMATGAQ